MCRRLLVAAMFLLLSGCTLTPDYERPVLDVPEAFIQPADGGASIANLEWWNLFRDTQLQYLIRTAGREQGPARGPAADSRGTRTADIHPRRPVPVY
jgi:multidrug efflux system outer membrane protein